MLLHDRQKSSRKHLNPLNFQQLHHFSGDIQMFENIEDDHYPEADNAAAFLS